MRLPGPSGWLRRVRPEGRAGLGRRRAHQVLPAGGGQEGWTEVSASPRLQKVLWKDAAADGGCRCWKALLLEGVAECLCGCCLEAAIGHLIQQRLLSFSFHHFIPTHTCMSLCRAAPLWTPLTRWPPGLARPSACRAACSAPTASPPATRRCRWGWDATGAWQVELGCRLLLGLCNCRVELNCGYQSDRCFHTCFLCAPAGLQRGWAGRACRCGHRGAGHDHRIL